MSGYEQRIKQQDYLQWLYGHYTLSAVATAVEHCLAGNKAQSEYLKEPITQLETQPSEDKLQQQRDMFVAQLEILKTNFELSHQKNDSV